MSYSWDFLICIKFCATMVIVLNPPACFARLACVRGFFLDPQCLLVITELVSFVLLLNQS